MICKKSIRQLGHLSWMFFTLSLCSIFLYQSASVIIAHYRGPQEVTPYSITWQLFTVALLPQSILFSALWPTFTEALARGDHAWVRRTFRATMMSTLLLNAAVSVGLLTGGRLFIGWWAGTAAVPALTMIALMSLWFLTNSIGGVVATFLNGAGQVRIQVLSAPPTALVSVVASLLLARSFGTNGILLAMVLAYTIGALTPATVVALRLVAGHLAGGKKALVPIREPTS